MAGAAARRGGAPGAVLLRPSCLVALGLDGAGLAHPDRFVRCASVAEEEAVGVCGFEGGAAATLLPAAHRLPAAFSISSARSRMSNANCRARFGVKCATAPPT